MNQVAHNRIVSFIWSIADDCLRDVYVRGKYRDVILPMTVLRRLDALLEPTKEAVLKEYQLQTADGSTELIASGLENASGYVFYNTSPWTLRKISGTAGNNREILLANMEEYLDGYSDNVKEIIEKFDLKAQVRHMVNRDILLDVIEKFTSDDINLTPHDIRNTKGELLPGISNLGMGYVFEELIRKFNEENNEEAGEHFTPREVIKLMTHLIFLPIKNQIPSIMTVYDPACGSGGMLTESQNFILDENGPIAATNSAVHLYGKEINDETYAICKSDMMIKGNDPSNIRNGSTLSEDEFKGYQFDFMLSNPPYGKSWASEVKHIKNGKDIIDSRFRVNLTNYWGELEEDLDATPRTSDGQLLFLLEMVDKMKDPKFNKIGSRIASVHNGSSLFTGDAGGGESNIRRYIIENDYLEAIIQLPNNIFYNTGITTYIWLLSNNKRPERRGKVQLIDANKVYEKLRKNLGDKNCALNDAHIDEIMRVYEEMEIIDPTFEEAGSPNATLASQIFNNEDFGYYRVNIERPDRRQAQLSAERIEALRFNSQNALNEAMQSIYETWGDTVYEKDFFKTHREEISQWLDDAEISISTKQKSTLLSEKAWHDQRQLVIAGNLLMEEIGTELYNDFNHFKTLVEAAEKSANFKAANIKLTASDRNKILEAVSWYDESAEKVIRRVEKLKGEKLEKLLTRLGCEASALPDFGYYPTDKPGEYLTYESCSALRDSESIPLNRQNPNVILDYFREEVKPHVDEAWIDLESVKIGYEISFNKYFYRHKPLRSLSEVTNEILALEKEADGLIADILNFENRGA